MKKNGFTLIELLAVIVVLAIVAVLGTTTVLPLLSDARESAFRTEASDVITAFDAAKILGDAGKREYGNPTGSSCQKGKIVCITVSTLINWGTYDGDSDTYKGKVIIDTTNTKPTYTLYFKKGAEFAFVNQNYTNYVDNGDLVVPDSTNWNDSYETCSCE